MDYSVVHSYSIYAPITPCFAMSSAGSHKMKTYTAAAKHIRDGEKLFLVRMQHNRHIRYTSNEIVRQPLNLANDFYLSEAILNFLPKYS